MKKTLIIAAVALIFIIAAVMVYQNFFISESLDNNISMNISGTMKITSTSFGNNEMIPSEFTCDGSDISPPLEIDGIPQDAKTVAIVVDDPDAPAGTWVHWVVFNIPVPQSSLKIGQGSSPGTEGSTSSRTTGYGGPCPPSGTHRYFFKAYALDSELELDSGATKSQLEAAMQGHILDKSELVGLYARK